MNLTGWGKYPVMDSKVIAPNENYQSVLKYIELNGGERFIARGLGRSYGDSSLAPVVVSTENLDHFLAFDEEQGVLTCSAGVSLNDVLETFVPRGWFLFVTPGTKFVTVGGAIASDVHGKNHHIDGCFSEHVKSVKIMTGHGQIISCSREINPELFYATCGGMGLTGVILEVSFKLKPIRSSYIHETTIKTANLKETFELFDESMESTYSVAWVDCLSTGESLGRSLLMLGEHSEEGGCETGKSSYLNIPVNCPDFLLNHYSIKLFNNLYYNKMRSRISEKLVHYEPYFYPLDGVQNWNRMYGKNGFIQYQFVLPRQEGLEGMTTILERISRSGRGSFLAVLKAFGKSNDNYLSFPMEGYTLALDFKIDSGLFDFLNGLDQVVLACGGRLYLTKDARMSESVFKTGYPLWEKFVTSRVKYGADKIFNSMQSHRIGL